MNPTSAKDILNAARIKVAREHQTKADQLDWAARQAVEKEKRRVAFLKEHGGLLWRAMAYYGQNRFLTSVLDCYQAWGDITERQLDSLRKSVAFLERGLTAGRILS